MKQLKEDIKEIVSKAETELHFLDVPFSEIPKGQKFPFVKFDIARTNAIQDVQFNNIVYEQFNFLLSVWFPFPEGCQSYESATETAFDSVVEGRDILNEIVLRLTSHNFKFNYLFPTNFNFQTRFAPKPVTEIQSVGVQMLLSLRRKKKY